MHTGKFSGAQQIVLKALSMLGLECIDMVLLYDNKVSLHNLTHLTTQPLPHT